MDESLDIIAAIVYNEHCSYMLTKQTTRQTSAYITCINQMRRGALTIPAEMRKQAEWGDGHFFEIVFDKKTRRIYILPKPSVSEGEFVELSRNGEAMLRQAMQEVANGKVKKFKNAVDLIQELRS